MGEMIRTAADSMRLLAAAQGMVAGASGVQAALAYDSQVRGLAAYAKNAEDLQAQLGRLQELAKLPGLGLSEVRQGVLNLEAAGLSASLAERALGGFGNALALAGRGKAELDGVILALGQIASKGKLSAEEINQIAERVPQIRGVLQSAFGTAVTEDIQKMGLTSTEAIDRIVRGLEALPRATGGYQVTLENLADAMERALLPIGRGLLDIVQSLAGPGEKIINVIGNLADQIGMVFSAIAESGVARDAILSLLNVFGGGAGQSFIQGFATISANVLAFIKLLPELVTYAVGRMRTSFQGLFADLSDMLAGMFDMMASLPSMLPFASALRESAMGASAGAAALRATAAMTAPKPVDFAGVRNEFLMRIMANIKPQQLPAGLIFGGQQAGQQAGNQPTQAETTLDRIERNTRQTADELTKRQIGGGQIAQLGVTAAEMRASRGMMAGSGYQSSAVMGGSIIERQIRALTMDQIRRSGTYGIPRG